MTMTLNYFNLMIKQSTFRKLVLIGGVLPIFITGCTGLSGTQPPAPVYSGNRPYNAPMPKQAEAIIPKKAKVDDVVQVVPLAEFTPIVEEAIEIKVEPITPPVPNNIPATVDSGIPKVIEIPAPSRHLLIPTAPAETGVPKFEPNAPIEFKPAETGTALSPAVTALVAAANQSSKSGDLESATAAIERAIRIEPRNGELLYKLAVLRLKQSKPILAEDLAKKAALLAGKDNTLKKNSWLLIAHAKEMQNDTSGAADARTKAAGF
jgi:tetratricopeptide (TPR) repeat protein